MLYISTMLYIVLILKELLQKQLEVENPADRGSKGVGVTRGQFVVNVGQDSH